jgi:hypothetical protein
MSIPVENALLLKCDEILTEICDAADKSYPDEDECTCIVFDNSYLKEIRSLSDRVKSWKSGEHLVN